MVDFPYNIIDLTHTADPAMTSWNGSCGFQHEIKLDYANCKGDVTFRVQQFKMHAGVGTHIDAPAHAVPNGLTIDKLQLANLIAPCVCIDVSAFSHPEYKLTVDDIIKFEQDHKITISENNLVIVYTGWEQNWHSPNEYRNNYVFPSISEEAILLLLERKIVGIGIDTLSPDVPSSGFPVHKHVLGAGKYIIENVANAKLLPKSGAFSLALPLKGAELTESPARVIGLIPK